MMATAAVIGLSAGKRLLSSSYYYSDLTDKFSHANEHGSMHYQISSTKKMIISKKTSNCSPSVPLSNKQTQSIKAIKEHVDTISPNATMESLFQRSNYLEEESSELGYSVEALILLQKSMLEKHWNLSFEKEVLFYHSRREKIRKKKPVTCSGVSARQRGD
ncbi:RNA polymerase sigma factor [Quillaja saponaria]|uniref:RNA polymerase sigma factor n=1 Tax=Quillaja saponaria TaxID=32244 RepID=A0AAD7VNR3_QUISA|nr:RNA polymerase sigma factor [Quillaja saponaria]